MGQADLPDTGTNASLPRKKPYFAHCRENAARRKRERQTTEQKQRGRKKERDRKKLTKKRKKEEEKLFGRLATKLQTDINIMNNKDKEIKETLHRIKWVVHSEETEQYRLLLTSP